ncbi:TlpA family protein disulfide reductase [Caldivirga sp.]|uniref:TlpA family protein disulfide reductase n=2 Tax=Caldivirga sp. TaxID=2080243 RepID=UPI003D12F6F5
MRMSKVTIAVVLLIATVVILYLTFNHGSRRIGVNVGDTAPNAEFTLPNGSVVSLASFRGHYVLLYLVSTWCPDCAYGVAVLAHYVNLFESKGVYVIVLEQYDDLGYSGPPITSFLSYYGGNASRYFIAGVASLSMTKTYNPSLQLEVYYLISPNGRILYSGANLAYAYPGLISVIKGIG